MRILCSCCDPGMSFQLPQKEWSRDSIRFLMIPTTVDRRWELGGSYLSRSPTASRRKDRTSPWVSKIVPQRLKPSDRQIFTARLKPCRSYRDAFSFSLLAVALEPAVCAGCAQNRGLKAASCVSFSRPSLLKDLIWIAELQSFPN